MPETSILVALALSFVLVMASIAQPAVDTPFLQETAEKYSLGDSGANDVRAVAVDIQGNIWRQPAPAFTFWTKHRTAGEQRPPPNMQGPRSSPSPIVAGASGWVHGMGCIALSIVVYKKCPAPRNRYPLSVK